MELPHIVLARSCALPRLGLRDAAGAPLVEQLVREACSALLELHQLAPEGLFVPVEPDGTLEPALESADAVVALFDLRAERVDQRLLIGELPLEVELTSRRERLRRLDAHRGDLSTEGGDALAYVRCEHGEHLARVAERNAGRARVSANVIDPVFARDRFVDLLRRIEERAAQPFVLLLGASRAIDHVLVMRLFACEIHLEARDQRVARGCVRRELARAIGFTARELLRIGDPGAEVDRLAAQSLDLVVQHAARWRRCSRRGPQRDLAIIEPEAQAVSLAAKRRDLRPEPTQLLLGSHATVVLELRDAALPARARADVTVLEAGDRRGETQVLRARVIALFRDREDLITTGDELSRELADALREMDLGRAELGEPVAAAFVRRVRANDLDLELLADRPDLLFELAVRATLLFDIELRDREPPLRELEDLAQLGEAGAEAAHRARQLGLTQLELLELGQREGACRRPVRRSEPTHQLVDLELGLRARSLGRHRALERGLELFGGPPGLEARRRAARAQRAQLFDQVPDQCAAPIDLLLELENARALLRQRLLEPRVVLGDVPTLRPLVSGLGRRRALGAVAARRDRVRGRRRLGVARLRALLLVPLERAPQRCDLVLAGVEAIAQRVERSRALRELLLERFGVLARSLELPPLTVDRFFELAVLAIDRILPLASQNEPVVVARATALVAIVERAGRFTRRPRRARGELHHAICIERQRLGRRNRDPTLRALLVSGERAVERDVVIAIDRFEVDERSARERHLADHAHAREPIGEELVRSVVADPVVGGRRGDDHAFVPDDVAQLANAIVVVEIHVAEIGDDHDVEAARPERERPGLERADPRRVPLALAFRRRVLREHEDRACDRGDVVCDLGCRVAQPQDATVPHQGVEPRGQGEIGGASSVGHAKRAGVQRSGADYSRNRPDSAPANGPPSDACYIPAVGASGRQVQRYLVRLRRRAGAMLAIRAACLMGGAGLAVFALASAAIGPVVSVPVAFTVWIAIAAVGGGAAVFGLRGARAIRGSAVARLLADVRPELGSATRSASERDRDARARALAPELVEAHAARVREALADVPPERVVPLRKLRDPAVLGGLCAAGLAIAFILSFDRSASGAWALLHPTTEDEGGVRMAAIVSRVDARLVFPEYLARTSESLEEVARIDAPRGTSVTLRVETRVRAREGILEIGDTRVRLTATADGELEGRFVVRDDAMLAILVLDEADRWLRDPVQRPLRIVADETPRVALLSPEEDLVVELREEIPLSWEARDDLGLRAIELVVRTADRREIRRRMTSFDDVAEVEAAGEASVVPATFSAQPGDDLLVWIEAHDGDEVSGPKVGKSVQRRLTVASEATRRAAALADLEGVLDAAVHALADRLETEIPEDRDEAKRRHHRLAASTRRLTSMLSTLAASEGALADADVLSEIARRLERAITREGRLYVGSVAPRPRREDADARIVEELENDTLLLADMMGRAQIEDAAAIARELDDLRRQMVSLLEELRRADSPEARQALMAAIARAQARMRELAQRLAQMARDVPQDYVNYDALPQAETENALEALREAVERGDLDAAEQQLTELQRQIDSIAKTLGGGMEQFAEARFGPRERALAEALDTLAGLEAEQQRLARNSGEVRRRAAERALAETGASGEEAAQRLAQRAEQVARSLERAGSGGPVDPEAYERARQRMQDVHDALSTGDLGEARRMAEEASQDVENVSRDLDLSALMFPGAEGATSEAAREARQAAEQLRDLRRSIDRAIPRVGDFVDEGGQRQMREDGSRQGEVAETADRLAEQLEEGPDGAPLSPETAEGVREARESMDRGRRALERRDPIDASRAQEEAARRLTELREQLEREQQQREGGGAGGNQGGEGAFDREPVRIPGAEEFEGPMEMRRRLLDAMRESAPAGYEEAVRRYYEDLLR